MKQLFVFAQQPPTPNGTICPVEAESIQSAVAKAQEVLGVVLTRKSGGYYSSDDREFFLYFGAHGMEQLGRVFQNPLPSVPRFSLGQVVATPAALRAIESSQEVSSTFLIRHQSADWGDVDQSDAQANENALIDGSRIFSAYVLKDGTKIWIITEAADEQGSRRSTCILLPDDY